MIPLPQNITKMILASINHKGGTGKTVIAQNLAVCYANTGAKACIVDADPSQNSMRWFDARGDKEPRIPVFSNSNHRTIRRTVEDLYSNEGYDTIIIDSPPSLERIAAEIISLSHIVLIPISPTGGNDIWSTEQIAEEIDRISEEKGQRIPSWFVINRLQPNLKVHQMFIEALREHSRVYKIGILETMLHLRTAYGLANLYGQGVYEQDDSKASAEVVNLTNEIQQLFDKL
jgi:chromosome partitioning protein